MLHHGRHMTRMREFGDEMCRRIVAAGIPISRGFCAVGTLHPQIQAAAYTWRRGDADAMRRLAEHGLRDQANFRNSPIAAVQASRRMLRRRLLDAACPLDFPVLAELKAEGETDYVAFPLCFSNGEVNAITWSTDHAEGFSEAAVAGLGEVAETLAVIVELQSSRRIAQTLMNTYVGKRSGARVLSGAITRGSGEVLRAVIWFCDLRGFTELADSLPRAELIALLNDYFEVMADAVRDAGGEVLKFVGDGMLAIFELRDAAETGRSAAAALAAAGVAAARVATVNAERRRAGRPELRFGLALHLGEVTYGNIGAPDRLDFTVIGPAVNHASRLEKLAGSLGRPVVASASFAAAASGARLVSLGRH
ncbi:MAG TPA: adenylate/guanylate cyclase domain-containing protein, partial [Candidatus Sulfotelmatobacter sp.]|nr:adenylate/guanylate cyclase domain-containing protein [Candidatus Sulfotelmatobacter sp.]